MQHRRHDFAKNFLAANGARDMDAMKDIIYSELVDIIIEVPAQVTLALKESGVLIKRQPTDRQLVKLLVENLPDNKHLRSHIAKIIAQRHAAGFVGSNASYSNFLGICWTDECRDRRDDRQTARELSKSAEEKTSENGGLFGGAFGAIVTGIGSIFGVLSGKEKKLTAAQLEIEKERTKQIMLQMLANKKAKKGLGTGAIIAIVVVSLGVIGTIIYFATKKKK